jgi:hypothetical protein
MWDWGPDDDLTCAYEIAVLSVKLVDGLVPVKVGSGKRMPQLAVFCAVWPGEFAKRVEEAPVDEHGRP